MQTIKKVILQTNLTIKVIPITYKYQSLKRHEVSRKRCILSICRQLQIVAPPLRCAFTTSFKFVHIFCNKKSLCEYFISIVVKHTSMVVNNLKHIRL